MFAVAGDPSRDYNQHFEALVKDKEFCDANYSLFFPKKKSLMTLECEHCANNLIALAPKNCFTDDGKTKLVELKGVSTRGNLNNHLNEEAFRSSVNDGKITSAENFVLRAKLSKMTRQLLVKQGLSGVITKCVCLSNQACLPFIYGVKSENYLVK
jgi:hypothetical protein